MWPDSLDGKSSVRKMTVDKKSTRTDSVENKSARLGLDTCLAIFWTKPLSSAPHLLM